MKLSNYRILGVDPGTNQLGFAILEVRTKKVSVVKLDTLRMQTLANHKEKLAHIFNKLTEIIELYRPTEMAIEAPFFGKNVQSMLKLGRAQGVAIAAGMTQKIEISEYSPKKVKLAVTGNGNASKEQVAAMIDQILGKQEGQSFDATDAAAVALCHYYQSGSLLKGEKRYSSWEKFIADNPTRTK